MNQFLDRGKRGNNFKIAKGYSPKGENDELALNDRCYMHPFISSRKR